MTELQYETATITPIATAPTALFRRKREEIEENVLESSIFKADQVELRIEPTRPLTVDDELSSFPVTDVNRWIGALSHPKVRNAWDTFLSVLEQVHGNSTTHFENH